MISLAVSPRIRHSPFYSSTVAAGATDFTVYNKMLMPTSFGDPAGEYQALTERVAMWDVGSERQVQISGPDADLCAQYLSSRDLSKMVEGQGKYVAMCDSDGVLLNDPVLLKLSGGRYWFSIADSDMLLWCKAVVAERGFDVKVCEPDVSPLAIQGPLAEDLAADLFGEHVRSLKYFWFIETQLDGIPVVVCRSGWSKQGGFELFLQDGSCGTQLWDTVAAAGERYGVAPGAPNQTERVESGLLSWGGDTTPQSNPYEAGMAAYVQPNIEARFIGKQALQKIEADGPDRLLVGLVFDVATEVGATWMIAERAPVCIGADQVGTLSVVVCSPRMGRTIGVAQIDRCVVESGDAVSVWGPAGLIAASITSLPFA